MKTTTIKLPVKKTPPSALSLKREGDDIIIANPFDDYDILGLAVTPQKANTTAPVWYFILLWKAAESNIQRKYRLFIGKSGEICEAKIENVSLPYGEPEIGEIMIGYFFDGERETFVYPAEWHRMTGARAKNFCEETSTHHNGALDIITLAKSKTEKT
jgi:hypothetical protein